MTRTVSERRVFLHVGVPKSGTTFLQASLARNRAALRKAGVVYPESQETMFLAALDVRGTHKSWGRKRKEVEGRWDDLCRKARKFDGNTIVSHELLAAASVHQVIAALTMLRGLEVHVVVTARDLGRQATAEWQEGIKHGRQLTFDQFRHTVLAADFENEYARRFWAAQDLPGVLSRWASVVRAERVHVVCSPPQPAEPSLLWQRFTEALDLDAERFTPAGPENANASLGSAEIDLLRRVNMALDKRLTQPDYGQIVKRLYAQRLLTARAAPRPVVPAQMYPDLRVIGERWVKEIEKAGYPVYGNLHELMPQQSQEPMPHPDDVDTSRQVEVAAASTAELLLELHRAQLRSAQLEGENATLRKKRKRLKRKLK